MNRTNHAVACLHCGRIGDAARRGLCGRCYYRRELWASYPRCESPRSKRGAGITPTLSIPFVPTSALPGSAEKVAVLEQRLAACLPLFHPDDARHATGLPEIDSRCGSAKPNQDRRETA